MKLQRRERIQALRAETTRAPGTLNTGGFPGRLFFLLLLLVILAGCGKESPLPEGRTPPNPSAPARYDAPRLSPAASVQPGSSIPPAGSGTQWHSAPFYLVESELCPGVLVHSASRYLGLFSGLAGHGLGAPSHVAWSTPSGPRSFKNGDTLDVMRMEENWVLVWFAGAAGWTNWDSPWAVFLQHRPASMKLDPEGLHFTFSNRADDVVLMPLYGSYKPPQKGRDVLEANGLPGPKIKIKTWEWAAALPRDPLVRLRYWAGATRRFPIRCDESVSVNRAEDSATFRWRFEWHSIEDEWKTKPLRLAPLSPTLALAIHEPGFPVRFNAHPFNLEMFTPFGPWYGVPDVDVVEATFPLLQYVHETEAVPVRGGTNRHPAIAAANERLRQQVVDWVLFTDPSPAIWVDATWVAKALPHLEPVAQAQSNIVATLRSRFVPLDEARIAPGFLEAFWAYAHFSGDWELVRRQWPAVKTALARGANGSLLSARHWPGFGRDRVPANGDLGAPLVALARLAYQAGDLDAYHQACAWLVCDLVQLAVKQRGAGYFRENQPNHSMEFMAEPVFLTEVDSGLPGWRVDGPKYPAADGPRQFQLRWARFNDWDIGRFFQDYLGHEIRQELAGWTAAAGLEDPRLVTASTLVPLRSQLRSLLLNEPPVVLGAHAAPEPGIRPLGGIVANALCVLRTSQPVRFERLIPPGAPTPFEPSPSPTISSNRTSVGATVQLVPVTTTSNAPVWPELGWPEWRTPAGTRWTFGQIKAARHSAPRRIDVVPINPNTRVVVVELPSP